MPFSGLLLSEPLQIFGLVSLYLTNSLIRRRPILGIAFKKKFLPEIISYQVLATVSRGYP